MNVHTFPMTIFAALFLLHGCSTTPDIVLRTRDGQTARCEGFLQGFFINSVMGHRQQRDCLEDYQRAGYERLPEEKAK